MQSEEQLPWIAEQLGFPLVIKPRFSAGARGITIVRDLAELLEKVRFTRCHHNQLMIQEYIPGKSKIQCYITLDKNRKLKVVLCVVTLRNTLRETSTLSTVAETLVPDDTLRFAATFLGVLDRWGSATVQLKVDSRSNVPKLMEINPRPGIRLWQRTALGINEPMICLEISRDKDVKAVRKYPPRTLLIEPIEDFLGFGLKLLDLVSYKVRVGFLAKPPLDSLNPPMGFLELCKSLQKYLLQR
jgi:predicted ATP-grasp superfamily ATP-dependent carboligase